MKLTVMWRVNKHTRKKKRVKHKPKIHWQQLGLAEPAEVQPSLSMDEVRRQVVMMSSEGLGQGARSRPRGRSVGSQSSDAGASPTRKRRRGATE